MALDDLGLVPTLRKFVQDFEEKTRIRAVFDTSGKEKRLPSAMEAAMFRLVQEGFNNALKHAQPTFVSLEMTFLENTIQLLIEDNGVGFKLDMIEARAKSHANFGLIGMKERVELLQGKIEFDSKVGQGTQIRINVPIKAESGKELIAHGE
jgi:two-component system sensor histidine kinase DegS